MFRSNSLRGSRRKINSSTELSSSNYTNYHLTMEEQQQAMVSSTPTATHNQRHFCSSILHHQKTLAIALLTINTILLFADQNLMAPNLTAMADEFGFNEAERDRKLGGDIALAFFVLGAPVSLVIGCLSDVVGDRTRLFAWTILLGEGSCAATYWVRTYRQLYVCRAITGVSVGGALPLVFSILGDMFRADQRHMVSSLVGIGSGVGIFLGQGAAGFLGPVFGWRLPFLVVSAPALVSAVLFWLLVEDPERGQMEAANMAKSAEEPADNSVSALEEQHAGGIVMDDYGMNSVNSVKINDDQSERGLIANKRSEDEDNATFISSSTPKLRLVLHQLHLQWRTFRTLFATPTVILCLFQGAPGCVPWGIINVFLADYLAIDQGLTVQWATVVLLAFGIGNFVGMIVGGLAGSLLYRKDKRWPAILSGVSAMLGCLPFWALLNLPAVNNAEDDMTIYYYYPLATLLGVLSAITGPIVKATLQNTTMPAMRGQAFALFNTFDDFGRGLGPVFVALLIQTIGRGHRLPAFRVGASFWMICGLLNLATYCTVVSDEERVQRWLEEEQRRGHRKRQRRSQQQHPDRASLILQIGPMNDHSARSIGTNSSGC